MTMRVILRRSWMVTVILFFASATSFYYLKKPFTPTNPSTKSARINAITESAAFISGYNYKHVTKSLAELGRTPELSGHILFFNRVPNSGSEMILLLLQWLQGSNNFKQVRLKGGSTRKLSRLQQEQLVDDVTDVIRDKAVPLSFDRHVYFLNFTEFDRQSPTFINIIRDPIEKLASRFYYKPITPNPRNPDLKYVSKKSINKKSEESLDNCVKQKRTECTFKNGFPYDLTIPYFCGQDPRCMIFNEKWALVTAKSNVERYFPVVGVLEELNATLELFETKIPYFFKGVQDVYFKDLFQPHHNKNKMRPHVNEHIRSYLKDLFECEYDFYDWVKRRLFQQLQVIYGHVH